MGWGPEGSAIEVGTKVTFGFKVQNFAASALDPLDVEVVMSLLAIKDGGGYYQPVVGTCGCSSMCVYLGGDDAVTLPHTSTAVCFGTVKLAVCPEDCGVSYS